MLTVQKLEAMKRIKEEFNEINRQPVPNIGLTVAIPDPDNIFNG